MNCAEYLVDYLIRQGTTDIFGYAGGYIVPFMDALYSRPELKVHVCYNEQGCAFAANGYARASGTVSILSFDCKHHNIPGQTYENQILYRLKNLLYEDYAEKFLCTFPLPQQKNPQNDCEYTIHSRQYPLHLATNTVERLLSCAAALRVIFFLHLLRAC